MAEPRPIGEAAGRDTVRVAIMGLVSVGLGPDGMDWMSVTAATTVGASLGVLIPRAWDALWRIPT